MQIIKNGANLHAVIDELFLWNYFLMENKIWNRKPPMDGQGMAIRSMYPMCFGIIPAGDCLPDFLEMGSL